jgi:hypothetical protein
MAERENGAAGPQRLRLPDISDHVGKCGVETGNLIVYPEGRIL